MKNHYLVIDVALCHDCNNCFISCKDEHVGNEWLPYSHEQPIHGHRWMDIQRTERGQYPRIDVAYLPTPCQHCQNAPCVNAHPDCISKREDGLVLIDPEKAKGKKEVVDSCPYGAIYWNEELEVPQKCTLCAHILDDANAELKVPRCVHSCPTGAMAYYYIDPIDMDKKIKAEGLENYRPELGTKGHVFYKNLYRFEKAFIAGALLQDNECAENIEVSLKGQGVDMSQLTDCFGDFKFDALLPGDYSLYVAGKEIQKITLAQSLNLGTLEI
jgi:Fe-S-cluster-containing dehydrogenase component